MRKPYPDPGTLAGLLVVFAVAIAVLLLMLGIRAHARPNPAWQAQRIQAEQGEDYETLRRLRYVSKAGTKSCPEGSQTWCVPSVGVPVNCCGEADAYEADDFEVDTAGNLWGVLTCNDPKDCEEVANKVVRNPGEKFRIPRDKLLLSHDPVNDTGHGWIWISPSSTDEDGLPVVFCFTPGAGN